MASTTAEILFYGIDPMTFEVVEVACARSGYATAKRFGRSQYVRDLAGRPVTEAEIAEQFSLRDVVQVPEGGSDSVWAELKKKAAQMKTEMVD